jgi:hypothetical protein
VSLPDPQLAAEHPERHADVARALLQEKADDGRATADAGAKEQWAAATFFEVFSLLAFRLKLE